jgi:uncharacterized protein YjbI with pentapeptide repeats
VRRFTRGAHGTLDQVLREATAATHAAAEGNAPAAASHAERAVVEVLAWYGPMAARRWVVQTSLALLVGFGGLIGTAMLFRQTLLLGEQNKKITEQTDLLGKENDLLRNQNEKVDQQTDLLTDQNRKLDLQTVTAEAQRRAGLAAELFSILQAVSLIQAETTEPSDRNSAQIPRGLKSRIVAFSRAATAYRIIEVPEGIESDSPLVPRLADRARSPERGQLLVGLVLAGIDISIIEGADFSSADLRAALLRGSHLPDTRLFSADLTRADLTRADLTGAILKGADLTGANLNGANLTNADLRGVNLTGANLADANLTNAELIDANLTNANLTIANLTKAALTNADLTGPEQMGAALTGAIVNRAKGIDLQWGWELYNDGGLVRVRESRKPPTSSPP